MNQPELLRNREGARLWRDDLRESQRDFQEIVWPRIAPLLGGGRLVSVEEESPKTKQLLDLFAGIDAWHIQDQHLRMRGIASRVQWIWPGRPPYDTFTIRWRRNNGSATEFEKRLAAMRDNGKWLFPYLTCQAYLTENHPRQLLSAAVIRTRDLFEHVADLIQTDSLPLPTENKDRSSSFLSIAWRAIPSEKIKIVR
jgi:hypothetical protein